VNLLWRVFYQRIYLFCQYRDGRKSKKRDIRIEINVAYPKPRVSRIFAEEMDFLLIIAGADKRQDKPGERLPDQLVESGENHSWMNCCMEELVSVWNG